MAPASARLEMVSPAKTPRLFWWTLGLCTVLAMVPTVWTRIDIDAASVFFAPGALQQVEHWWWVQWINGYVPAAFRVMVFAALAAWITASFVLPHMRPWRMALMFVVLAGALGPGLLVNSGFKDNWQRARPYQVQAFGGTQEFTRATVMTDQCDNNCSFVSGHVACGFFFASLMLLWPRYGRFWAGTGIAAGWTIGFARMADHAHWLSDVLWAAPITLMCSWMVWRLLLYVYAPRTAAVPTE